MRPTDRKSAPIVYNALVDVGVPKDDRFQVIGEHSAEDFLFDSDYPGIHRTEELVIIQITWNEGRNIEQKRALYKAIADGLHSAIGLRREDVFINLIEVKKENWFYATVKPSMPRTVWLALVVRAIAYPPLIGGMIIIGLGAGLLNGETTKVGMTVIPRDIRGQHGGKTMSLVEIGPEIGSSETSSQANKNGFGGRSGATLVGRRITKAT